MTHSITIWKQDGWWVADVSRSSFAGTAASVGMGVCPTPWADTVAEHVVTADLKRRNPWDRVIVKDND